MNAMQFWPVPVPFPCPAPPAGMAEWIKLLITALAGLTVGTLLEPIRSSIQYFFAKRRTHSFVADEINALALSMSTFLHLRNQVPSTENPITQKPHLSTERFDYAFEKNRDHLYNIPAWESLRRFYDAVKQAKSLTRLTDKDIFYLNMEFALLAERTEQGILGPTLKKKLIENKFSNLKKVANHILTKPLE